MLTKLTVSFIFITTIGLQLGGINSQKSSFTVYEKDSAEDSNFYIHSSYSDTFTSYGNLNWGTSTYHLFTYNGGGILYDEANYGDGAATAIGVAVPYCVNNPVACRYRLPNTYMSFRFTSNIEDPTVPTISLFADQSYRGAITQYSTNQPDITIAASSYYRTGAAGNGVGCWTAFTETSYEGFSLAFSSTNATNLGTTSFRSLRLGCAANAERTI